LREQADIGLLEGDLPDEDAGRLRVVREGRRRRAIIGETSGRFVAGF
jgi:hypothetical protein